MNPPPSTLELCLASLHARALVAANDPLSARACQLLDSLAQRYPQESREYLADIAVGTYLLVTTTRSPLLFLDFLARIESAVARTPATELPFADVCSLVAVMVAQQTSEPSEKRTHDNPG